MEATGPVEVTVAVMAEPVEATVTVAAEPVETGAAEKAEPVTAPVGGAPRAAEGPGGPRGGPGTWEKPGGGFTTGQPWWAPGYMYPYPGTAPGGCGPGCCQYGTPTEAEWPGKGWLCTAW